MTLLIFLARTTWAGIVTSNFLSRLHRRQSTSGFFGSSQRLFVIGVVILHVLHSGLRRRFLGALGAHLHGHQQPRHLDPHQIKQRLEKLEGLALVLLLGIFLGVAAQMDALTQMIKRGEMLAPM